MSTNDKHKKIPDHAVEGEGSYAAAEQYNRETQAAAADKQATAKAAREAADALDSAEGAELKAAEKAAAQGETD